MEIAGRKIGRNEPPWIVAELSANHGGSLSRALQLVEHAKEAGADIVKFQYYTPDSITLDCSHDWFILKDGPWKGRRLYDLYQEAHTPPDWFPALFAHAQELGIPAFASVFSVADVGSLQALDPPAYKISSFDIADLALIKAVRDTGKPVIVSTGMATGEEILDAYRVLCQHPHLFLHCISGYPTPIAEANLQKIAELRLVLGHVGISDHSLGHEVAVAAVALGAVAIEKHLTDQRGLGGPDAAFSLEPKEFAALVQAVRSVHRALSIQEPLSQQPQRAARKGLYYARDICAGALVSASDIRVVRPTALLPPAALPCVVGATARHDLKFGYPVSMDDLVLPP